MSRGGRSGCTHAPAPSYNHPTYFQMISRANTLDQNVRNKLNEIRQRQLESENNPQAHEPSTAASDMPLKFAALGGVVAGLIIAWLINSFLPTENADLIAQRSSVAIHENDIREANKTIEQLNDRVELLTNSIYSLESELTHTIESIAHNKINEKTSSADQELTESTNAIPPSTPANSQASGETDSAAKSDKTFIPTHVVKDRLNIRSSTSLDDAPIGVLSAGTEVSYIDEANGWYYVDTQQFGKGWCTSEYLSPLSSSP